MAPLVKIRRAPRQKDWRCASTFLPFPQDYRGACHIFRPAWVLPLTLSIGVSGRGCRAATTPGVWTFFSSAAERFGMAVVPLGAFSVPEGHRENSPAFQRRESCHG